MGSAPPSAAPQSSRRLASNRSRNRRILLEREADGAARGVDRWLFDFRLGVIPFNLSGLQGIFRGRVHRTSEHTVVFCATRENRPKRVNGNGNVTRMLGGRSR